MISRYKDYTDETKHGIVSLISIILKTSIVPEHNYITKTLLEEGLTEEEIFEFRKECQKEAEAWYKRTSKNKNNDEYVKKDIFIEALVKLGTNYYE
jgi:bacterioferritin (cytochrome b1)